MKLKGLTTCLSDESPAKTQYPPLGQKPELTIGPTDGLLQLNLQELWEYREFLYFLVWRDIKVRYKQTVSGERQAAGRGKVQRRMRGLPMATPVNPTPTLIEYPETDGLPVAESDFQLNPLLYAVGALNVYFQDRPDVYVAGNLFIYYAEGNPRAVVAPDVFVVFGAAKRQRTSYFLWREPKGPDFVLEITSRQTRRQDQEEKPAIYAALGVREYVQYDPTGDYLVPPLQGRQLVGGQYHPMPVMTLSDGTLVLSSAVLGLELRLSGGELPFFEAATGRPLLSLQEAERALREAEARAQQEAIARQAAEARLAELEARLRALQ